MTIVKLLQPHAKKGASLDPYKLMPFAWDKKPEEVNKLSAEKLKYINERRKLIKKKGVSKKWDLNKQRLN
jgi:hypothetical protein